MAWRPDPVMQALGWNPFPTRGPTVVVEMCGRQVKVNPFMEESSQAFAEAMVWSGYEDPTDWIGTYKYRTVAGKNVLSNHAYMPGVAFDWDYGGDTDGDGDPTIDKNPHLHRKVVASDYGNTIQLVRANVDAVLAIRTTNGKAVWRWLGDRNGDSMHFDIICRPDDIATGIDWSTVGGNDVKITDATWMTMFHSGVPGVKGYGRYYCSNDGTVDWSKKQLDGVTAPWGSNPHSTAPDGMAQQPEKDNAFNYLLQGFAKAAGSL